MRQWVSKNGNVRKQEFLDAAINLFYKKGYDKTSIEDIIREVKVSKGAFYHYFESKENLLEDIVDWQSEARVAIITKIVDDPKMNALEKMNALIVEQRDELAFHFGDQRDNFVDILDSHILQTDSTSLC